MLFGGRVELTMSGSTRLVLGCLLCDLFIDGNLIGSLMKKIGYTESAGGLRQLFKNQQKTYSVVENPIMVSFVRVQLHGPTVDISCRIGGTSLKPNSRDSEEDWRFLPDLVQEAGRGNVGAVVGYFELAVCTVHSTRVSV